MRPFVSSIHHPLNMQQIWDVLRPTVIDHKWSTLRVPSATVTIKKPPLQSTGVQILEHPRSFGQVLKDSLSLQPDVVPMTSQDRIDAQMRFNDHARWRESESHWNDMEQQRLHPAWQPSHESVIGMVWQLLKDVFGFVVWTYEDLFHYLKHWKDGHWSWLDLTKDVTFLWRLGIAALITVGLFQIVQVTESVVRLSEALVRFVTSLFGIGKDTVQYITDQIKGLVS